MVTAVKCRKALLNSDVEEYIKESLKRISERYKIVIDEFGINIMTNAHSQAGAYSVHLLKQ